MSVPVWQSTIQKTLWSWTLTDEHNRWRCSEKIWVYKNASVGRSCSPSVCVIVRQTNYVKPLLREPLLPGVWTVKMVYESAVVAFTQFLVTPLQFVSGANVSQQQAGWVWLVWHVLFHIYLWRSRMTAGDFPALLPCLQYTHLSWRVAPPPLYIYTFRWPCFVINSYNKTN